jgi:hypothetical protein
VQRCISHLHRLRWKRGSVFGDGPPCCGVLLRAKLKVGCQIGSHVDKTQSIFDAVRQQGRAGLLHAVERESPGPERGLARAQDEDLVVCGVELLSRLEHDQRTVNSARELILICSMGVIDKSSRAVGGEAGDKAAARAMAGVT